jgi:hypothetical protein
MAMPLRALIAVLVLGVFTSQARAADRVGYAEAFNVLYSVNLDARTATQIGSAGMLNGQPIANIEGLTFSPGGVLYAVSDAGATKTLLTIDKTTGLATPVGTLNLGTASQLDLGLAFTCDGSLWMSSANGNFWQVDPGNASVRLVGKLGATITGLASNGSAVFGAGSQGDNHLYSIDTKTGATTAVGGYGSANFITTASPGFDATGQLWAILDYVPPPQGNNVAQWSDLASVELSTGAMSNRGAITPSSSASAPNLAYIGLKGLAVPNSVCAVAAGNPAVPSLDLRGLAALIAIMLLAAGTRLRRRRPTC